MSSENREQMASSDAAEMIENTKIVEQSLDKYGIFASRTRGTSMWPLFRTHRDTVYIKKVEGILKKHEVALYTSRDGRYIMHRVIRVKEKEYLIRGDNTYIIEHIPHERVIGVLMEFDRKGKHHTTDDLSYRIYTAIWCAAYPIRYLLYHPAHFVWRVLKKLFRRDKEPKNTE